MPQASLQRVPRPLEPPLTREGPQMVQTMVVPVVVMLSVLAVVVVVVVLALSPVLVLGVVGAGAGAAVHAEAGPPTLQRGVLGRRPTPPR